MTKKEALIRATELANEMSQRFGGEDTTVVALAIRMHERAHMSVTSNVIREQIEELWLLLGPVVDTSCEQAGIFPKGN